MSTPQAGTGVAATARTMALAMIGGLVVLVLAMWFVVGQDSGAPVPVAIVAGQLVAGVLVHGLLDRIGYRAEPLERGLEPDVATRRSLAAWTSTMSLRFALSDAIAIISIALTFALTTGFAVVLVGAAVSLVLVLVHVWPGSRPVGRLADNLERDGQRSGLREAFGMAGGSPGGAIQEL